MTESITSAKNALLKEVRRAVSKGTLTEDGFAVAEGFHLLDEALASHCNIATVLVSDHVNEPIEDRVPGDVRVVTIPHTVFSEIEIGRAHV